MMLRGVRGMLKTVRRRMRIVLLTAATGRESAILMEPFFKPKTERIHHPSRRRRVVMPRKARRESIKVQRRRVPYHPQTFSLLKQHAQCPCSEGNRCHTTSHMHSGQARASHLEQ